MESNKILNDNKVLLAGAIGVASTVVGEIFAWVFVYLGTATYSTYQLNSLIVTYDKTSVIIGFILNLLAGSIIGAAVYLTLKKWGDKHIILVSSVYTLVAWLFLEIAFNGLVDKNILKARELSGYYSQFASAVIHAIAKGLMLKWFIFDRE